MIGTPNETMSDVSAIDAARSDGHDGGTALVTNRGFTPNECTMIGPPSIVFLSWLLWFRVQRSVS